MGERSGFNNKESHDFWGGSSPKKWGGSSKRPTLFKGKRSFGRFRGIAKKQRERGDWHHGTSNNGMPVTSSQVDGLTHVRPVSFSCLLAFQIQQLLPRILIWNLRGVNRFLYKWVQESLRYLEPTLSKQTEVQLFLQIR